MGGLVQNSATPGGGAGTRSVLPALQEVPEARGHMADWLGELS